MLSTSYKAVLIMDQLRQRTKISVPQLQTVFDISESSYSRISKRVYAGHIGSLKGPMDLKVQRVIGILVAGIDSKKISERTRKRKGDDIKDVLAEIETFWNTMDQGFKTEYEPSMKALLTRAEGLLL